MMDSEFIHREETESTKLTESSVNELTKEILAAAFDVHTCLGPGLLESAYERAMAHELGLRRIDFASQVTIPIQYKGMSLDTPLRLDLIVAREVIVEIKAVANIDDIHRTQLLTYLRMAGLRTGLLINFNVKSLNQGIRRVFNTHKTSFTPLTPFTPGR